jgi:16S rRNA (cytosine967-C5)-methyltransferase
LNTPGQGGDAKRQGKKPPGDRSAQRDSKPGLATRKAAHRLLGAILDAGTSMDALTDEEHGHPHYLSLDPRDRALVRAILMAVLRHYGDLDAIITHFTEKPLPAGATSVRHMLMVGLAQILLLDIPDHSAVDLAVSAAQDDPRSRRFGKLVNAVLRRAGREKAKLQPRFDDHPVCAPSWFCDRLTEIYGAAGAEAILSRHRTEAPVDLTLRRSETINAEAWAAKLDAEVLPTGSLRLRNRKVEIADLPGFAEGAWWVQDASAAIPARLFGDLSGKRVADLCAAPGGKTAQLADMGAAVTALDLSKNRLKRLSANLTRLGFTAACDPIAADLFRFEPDVPFDAVLLDAPCSSTGTVRRHPDVPFTKSMADIEKLAGLQARMLDRAAGMVTPGGLLVFSNCSLDPMEGEDVARAFVEKDTEFEIVPVGPDEVAGLTESITEDGFIRLTPAMLDLGDPALGGVDGFFVARFRRNR